MAYRNTLESKKFLGGSVHLIKFAVDGSFVITTNIDGVTVNYKKYRSEPEARQAYAEYVDALRLEIQRAIGEVIGRMGF
jgi:RecB family endonuclease NucS